MTNEKKHAYLIICHNHFQQLDKLLNLLDDARNDIYIHVDQKVGEIPPTLREKQMKHSPVYFVDRVSVNWGGYSMVQCEMNLLEAAVQNEAEYAYYHLISGVDLPLKTQNQIHGFFDENAGKEFISFSTKANQTKDFLDRISVYHFFQEKVGRSHGALFKLESLLVKLQQLLHINRLGREKDRFYKGNQWFSITDEMAKFITLPEQKAFVEKYLKWSCCSDELFIQTLVMNSPLKDNISQEKVRMIDWKRGNPYTFRAEDYDALMQSDSLFARKFDEDIDNDVIETIVHELLARQSSEE